MDIEEKYGLLNLENLEANHTLYALGILTTYGKEKRKSLDDFVADLLEEKIKKHLVEEATLLLGLHVGYAALRNQYKNSLGKRDVKFRLDSKLDYHIIESLYYAAFRMKVEDLSYLDAYCPVWKSSGKVREHETFMILDKNIVLGKNAVKDKKLSGIKTRPAQGLLEQLYPDGFFELIASFFTDSVTNPFISVDNAILVRNLKKYTRSSLEEFV